MKKVSVLSLLLLSVALACNLPSLAIPLTPTPEPSETPPPAAERYSACGWMWATEDLPELSKELSAHLSGNNLPQTTVIATAYGENCLNQQGDVEYFLAMQTDFYVTIPVDRLDDATSMGDLAGEILTALDSFPRDELPGNGPGQVQLRFTAGEDEKFFWFSYHDWLTAREAGLQGADLLEALANK